MHLNKPWSSDEITRAYLDSLLLETRYLDSDLASTKLELYGETFESPIMTAALSHLGGTHENGMVEFAKGAQMAGVVHWVGMGDEQELEAIMTTGAKTIKIIKPHADNEEIFRRIDHAVKAGVFAVGIDIDHAFNGDGGYDLINGLPMKPKSVDEIHEFVKACSVPFIIKGVLSVSDAKKCVKAGAKGIVISHHHGIMNYSVPPLMVLPEIVKAIGHQIPIFVDCGITSGMDAFKALALGATAVSVGRDLMEPLKKGGKEAVCERLKELNRQLISTMSRTGALDVNSIDSSVIWQKNF